MSKKDESIIRAERAKAVGGHVVTVNGRLFVALPFHSCFTCNRYMIEGTDLERSFCVACHGFLMDSAKAVCADASNDNVDRLREMVELTEWLLPPRKWSPQGVRGS